MTKIAIVTGSIRPGRQSLTVARWVQDLAQARGDADYEIVDIADFDLPVWDEERSPSQGPGVKPHSRAFSARMAEFDGYVFVVAEYNHSMTGALKNAFDYLYAELADKAAGFVSYGSVGGARAVEHVRGVLSEMHVAHVRNAVALTLAHDFENYTTFTPTPASTAAVGPMLDQLLSWTRALEALRSGALESADALA